MSIIVYVLGYDILIGRFFLVIVGVFMFVVVVYI